MVNSAPNEAKHTYPVLKVGGTVLAVGAFISTLAYNCSSQCRRTMNSFAGLAAPYYTSARYTGEPETHSDHSVLGSDDGPIQHIKDLLFKDGPEAFHSSGRGEEGQLAKESLALLEQENLSSNDIRNALGLLTSLSEKTGTSFDMPDNIPSAITAAIVTDWAKAQSFAEENDHRSAFLAANAAWRLALDTGAQMPKGMSATDLRGFYNALLTMAQKELEEVHSEHGPDSEAYGTVLSHIDSLKGALHGLPPVPPNDRIAMATE